jgi:prepilin-type N-terminal cleavage/methylation domain-containing protein
MSATLSRYVFIRLSYKKLAFYFANGYYFNINYKFAKGAFAMLNKLKKDRKGFTIIEVMIVLAIAGLILLIVFLAVPALQRSARNTSRKEDVAQVAAAVANFIADNGGALPTEAAASSVDTTQDILFCSGSAPSGVSTTAATEKAPTAWTGSPTCSSGDNNTESVKFGYYNPSGVFPTANVPIFFNSLAGTSGAFTASLADPTVAADKASDTNVSVESMVIDLGYGCNSTSTYPSTLQNDRTASVLYATETGTSAALQCVEQ